MTIRDLPWVALPLLLVLSGCPSSGGGSGITEGSPALAIAYVANSGSNDITGYTIDTVRGALTVITGSPFPTLGTNPQSVTVALNGTVAYVANSGSSTVTAFTIGGGGVLTQVPTSVANPNPVTVGTTPGAVTVSPNGQFLYVANSGSNNVTAFTIGAGGVLTQVPTSVANPNPATVGTTPGAVTVSPNGQFLYVANSASNDVTAFTIGAGGVLTPVPGSVANPNPVSVGGTTPNGVSVSPDGQFLYVSNGGGNVSAFVIGGGTGVLTPITGSPFAAGASPSGITVEPNGQFVYVANGGGNVSAYAITTGTGVLVPLAAGLGNPFPAGSVPSAIATPGRP